MIPARPLYGSAPQAQPNKPFESQEPRPLAKMSIPLSTLKNPGSQGMYRVDQNYMTEKTLPIIATMKGWGVNMMP